MDIGRKFKTDFSFERKPLYCYIAVVYNIPITSITGKMFLWIWALLATAYPGSIAGAGLQEAIQSTLLAADNANTSISERMEKAIVMERIRNNLKLFSFYAIGGYVAIMVSHYVTSYFLARN